MKEVWKDIDNYEGIYQVSNLGNVKTLSRQIWNGKGFRTQCERILKQSDNEWGYNIVTLTKDSKRKPYKVHRLVAQAFIPNPENKEQVNHIDGNKKNNNVQNLEWNTRQENITHAYINKLSNNTKTSNLIALKDDNDNIISQYSGLTILANTINIDSGKILKTLTNNNVNFEHIISLNKDYPIDLELNKLTRSTKYFPFALHDEDMNLLALYTNGSLMTRFTGIPENIITKANKNGIIKYKKQYHIKKISFVDFFTLQCDVIDQNFIIK